MSPSNIQTLWNIPYRRNRFFTGREEILSQIHHVLHIKNVVVLSHPLGISGLGGIGKTQVALEYAYRYQAEYCAVFWIQATSVLALTSGFVEMAHLLKLPEQDERDQRIVIEAVLSWLRKNIGWLLVFDNVDDILIVEPFLPKAGSGHILFTTRAYALSGIGQRLEVQKMEPETGALLLLYRSGVLPLRSRLANAAEDDRSIACTISQEMGGLPLALDQAGAYIQATAITLPEYLALYKARNADLLKENNSFSDNYPHSVATTWSISFQKVMQADSVAAELLSLCAFLYADTIPEEIITTGIYDFRSRLQSIASDPIKLDNIIKEILKFSLLQREPESHTFTIHRLVQVVLKGNMDTSEQKLWAEYAVRAVNNVFSDTQFAAWPLCQKCLPHAQVCMSHIEQWNLEFPQATQMLNQAGYYLQERAQYSQATPFLEKALTIRERTLESEHPNLAQSLNNLAEVYFFQDKYAQAEPLFQRALAIREQVLGGSHPLVAETLNDIARLYFLQGKYTQAEPLYQQALVIRTEALGSDTAEVAESLNNLARLYYLQGEFGNAEPLFKKALEIEERLLGFDHPLVALILNNLALLYQVQKRYVEAEPLYQRALIIRKQTLGENNPLLANTLHDLALLYSAQGKYVDAELFLQQARTIYEESLGVDHTYVASTLNNLGLVYYRQERFTEAELLFQRAREIYEKSFGLEHPYVATCLRNLASIRDVLGDFTQAELLYRRALAIREQALGLNHPSVAIVLENLARLLRKMQKDGEALDLENRAALMQHKSGQEK